MQFTTFTSFNVLLGLCTLFAVVSADFAQINAAVLEIDQRATGLKESLLNTDGSNYSSAISIDAAAIRLDSSITRGTKYVTATPNPVSVPAARRVIQKLRGTASTVEVISARLIAIEGNLQKIGVAAIAKQTLTQVTDDTKAFANALIDKTPEQVKADARKVQGQINAALDKAVAAYQ